MMPDFAPGTFVRVLKQGRNLGKLGVVVEPRTDDPPLQQGCVWVEMARPDPFGGVYRAVYHVHYLRVADELDSHG
jgi:hypothetical protein